MNGIHDMGGMAGFGSVEVEADEPVFHEPWEGWVYAVYLAGLGNGVFNVDEFRHSIERLPPAEYLASSYYERWLAGIEQLYLEAGVFDREAVDARQAAIDPDGGALPAEADGARYDQLIAGVRETFDVERAAQDPAFAVGDRVRVRNRHPAGHTRCPRYVRRATGVVEAVRGTEVVPDARAHGRDEADPVYNVRFEAAELWGDDGADDGGVHLDLWERYLQPADASEP